MVRTLQKPVDLKIYFLKRYVNYSIFYGMSGFSGAVVAAKGMPDPWIAFVSFAATWLGGLATLLLNDYFDRKVDPYIRPWRPIPAGKMSANQVLAFAFIVIVSGFTLTISLYNIACLLIALIAALSVFIYSISKRKRYMTHLVLTLSTALAPVYGYAAAAGGLSLELIPLASIMGLMIYMDGLSLALTASIPDAIGDKVGGAVTASVKLGGMEVAKIGIALIVGNTILGLLPFILGYLNISYLVCFLTTRITSAGIYIHFVKNPSQRIAHFVHNTQAFTRKGVFLAFPLGVLPTTSGIALAPILCLLIITTPISYYTSAIGLKY
jgi:4-hydroxybenzoate polyprenyltransferase